MIKIALCSLQKWDTNYEVQYPDFYSAPPIDPTILHSNGEKIASNYTVIIITVLILKIML